MLRRAWSPWTTWGLKNLRSNSMIATRLRVPGARASKQGTETESKSPFLGERSRVVTPKWIQHLFNSLHVLEASAASYSLKTDLWVSRKCFPVGGLSHQLIQFHCSASSLSHDWLYLEARFRSFRCRVESFKDLQKISIVWPPILHSYSSWLVVVLLPTLPEHQMRLVNFSGVLNVALYLVTNHTMWCNDGEINSVFSL